MWDCVLQGLPWVWPAQREWEWMWATGADGVGVLWCTAPASLLEKMETMNLTHLGPKVGAFGQVETMCKRQQ